MGATGKYFRAFRYTYPIFLNHVVESGRRWCESLSVSSSPASSVGWRKCVVDLGYVVRFSISFMLWFLRASFGLFWANVFLCWALGFLSLHQGLTQCLAVALKGPTGICGI